MANVLAQLLGTLTVDEFRSEYWGQKPLHVKGSLERVPEEVKFTLNEYLAAGLSDNEKSGAQGVSLMEAERIGGHTTVMNAIFSELNKDTARAQLALLEHGNSYEIQFLHRSITRLQAGSMAIRRELGYPANINIDGMLSPKGRGALVHMDPTHTCTVQLRGTKSWWISPEAVIETPLVPFTVHEGELQPGMAVNRLHDWEDWDGESHKLKNLVRYDVEPGDFLYIPSGTWHRTESTSELSLATLIQFEQARPLEVLASYFLRDVVRATPRWRALPPMKIDDSSDVATASKLREYFHEYHAAIDDVLNMSDTELVSAWARAVAFDVDNRHTQDELMGWNFVEGIKERFGVREPPHISPDTRLKYFSFASAVFRLEKVDGTAQGAFYHSNHRIPVEEESWFEWARVLSTRHEGFTAGESINWVLEGRDPLPWSEVQARIAGLVEHHILTVCS